MRVYLRKQNKQKSSEYERNIAIIIIINYQYDCCFFVYTFNFELNCVFSLSSTFSTYSGDHKQ